MRNLAFAFFVLATMLANATSFGSLITVEPDDFASGTNISSAVAGVTLSTFSSAPSTFGPPPDSFVYAKSNPLTGTAPTGSLVFATSAAADEFGSSWYTGDHQFRADFSSATDFVSIMTTSDGDGDTDFAYFEIFNSANVLLDSVTLIANNVAQTASFARGSADIAYLIVRNPPGGPDNDSFLLDKLQFNSNAVPEPATFAIWGLGFGFVSLVALRRKGKSESCVG